MRRSVSWHFLLYSLAVILVAIVAVGAVSLLLVEINFNKQEEQYLLDRGDQLVEPLQSALSSNNDPAELQSIASLALVTGHMRIRVVDRSGRVLADSGSYGQLFETQATDGGNSPLTAVQLLLDESGHYHGFRMPAELSTELNRLMMPGHHPDTAESLPFQAALTQQPPVADVSDTSVSLPLYVDNQVVGHAELSEGPAVGQAIRENLQQALLIGGLVALFVAAIAAIVAARQVTRPLLSLGVAADEMAQGNLQARAPGSKLAEIDHLSSQFNSMADQLAATIADLEAERSSLKRFIADASHELRTPLTALKTFNTLLSGDAARAPGRSAELLQESGRQLEHLDRLTTDLLDLSRLEARLNGTTLLPADIRPAIEEAVAAVQQRSQAREQTLDVSLPHSPVVVAHDPAMLRRAVHNLVSNAVKFTPERGRIQVSLAAGEAKATLLVEDDGPGIPAAEQPYIFDRFYRGRGATGQGSGLGLAIAREIAGIHGGAITCSSEEDAGSRFSLELPLADAG
jgi:signal transduction histidine kinase